MKFETYGITHFKLAYLLTHCDFIIIGEVVGKKTSGDVDILVQDIKASKYLKGRLDKIGILKGKNILIYTKTVASTKHIVSDTGVYEGEKMLLFLKESEEQNKKVVKVVGGWEGAIPLNLMDDLFDKETVTWFKEKNLDIFEMHRKFLKDYYIINNVEDWVKAVTSIAKASSSKEELEKLTASPEKVYSETAKLFLEKGIERPFIYFGE